VEFRNGSVPETQVFAAGAHEKNVFCVYKEGKAFPGHHIGDLGNLISTEAYERGVADFFEMFQVRPEVVACDLHPDYHSTRYAEALSTTLEVPLVRVQHHCAHIAAVLGEAGAPAGEHADNARRSAEKDQGVIGIAFDGTGYGTDGTIWGGEFLVFDGSGFTRAAHYEAVPMPGGEACVSSIDRMAAAYLIHTYGGQVPRLEMIDRIGEDVMSRLRIMIGRGMNTPRTSSCGRLFDAVSALLGLCVRPSYDAQGAILLEQAAGGSELQTGRLTGGLKNPYPFSFGSDGVLSFKPAIRAIVDDMRRGTPVSETAARFHTTVVYSAVEVCRAIAGRTGIRTAALSGGVFQNRIILERLWEALEQEGFTVLFHHQVPPNDGGIAFGQVVCALNGWGINGG
jgi:hydrogenase maturation protein HypF